MNQNLNAIKEVMDQLITEENQPKNFGDAMQWAQKLMPNLMEGTGLNPHFKSDFIQFEQLIQATRVVLLPLGLRFRQIAHVLDNNDVGIETIISGYGEEESYGVLPVKAQTQTPHGSGGAVTYGKRYSLAMALNISHQKDDDANKAQQETVSSFIIPAIKTSSAAKPVKPPSTDNPNSSYRLKKGTAIIVKNASPSEFLNSCRTHLKSPSSSDCRDIFKSSKTQIQRALLDAETEEVKKAFTQLINLYGDALMIEAKDGPNGSA